MATVSYGKLVTTKTPRGNSYRIVKKWKFFQADSLQDAKDIIKRRTKYSKSSSQKLPKGEYRILWRNREYTYKA